METINHIVATLAVSADDPAVDWTTGLTAPQLASLHDESRVVLRFRSGRAAAVYMRPVAADATPSVEVAADPVAEPEACEVGPFFWRSMPRFLFAVASTAVVIEVLRVSR